jgi:Fur family ferric uptake transcriptional regulator
MDANKIRAAVKQACQRQTRQRYVIAERLAQLADNHNDFTIEGLWHDLRDEDPHLGRATLYRVIEVLVNQGLLDRIEFADGHHRYRLCSENDHHHLTCMICRRVIEIQVTVPQEQVAAISDQTQFTIEGLSLTLYGRCARCQQRTHNSTRAQKTSGSL